MFPDHFVYTSVGSRAHDRRRRCSTCGPASPRCTCIPRVDTDELRASHPDWAHRVEDHAYVTADASLRDLIERSGATLIGYRALRDLQRRAPASA